MRSSATSGRRGSGGRELPARGCGRWSARTPPPGTTTTRNRRSTARRPWPPSDLNLPTPTCAVRISLSRSSPIDAGRLHCSIWTILGYSLDGSILGLVYCPCLRAAATCLISNGTTAPPPSSGRRNGTPTDESPSPSCGPAVRRIPLPVDLPRTRLQRLRTWLLAEALQSSTPPGPLPPPPTPLPTDAAKKRPDQSPPLTASASLDRNWLG